MLIYDFEVFKHDWLVVIADTDKSEFIDIINDSDKLKQFYEQHKNDIWIGYNSNHYDQYILKGILLDFDPKEINDFIIVKGKDGWQYSNLFRKIPLYNYDCMNRIDRGLKAFEGFMGNNIKETDVPFDIDRKLTESEIQQTLKYCRHDVEQTMQVFMERKSDFEAHIGLIKMFKLPLSYIGKTKVQMLASILDAHRQTYDDEFDISFPKYMKLNKYQYVADWFADKNNHDYDKKFVTKIANQDFTFAWGGVHSALPKYHSKGYFINMDVASLYPMLMINNNLLSRSCNPEKFKSIVDLRLKYKAEGNPLQKCLKPAINGTYGATKDKNNPLYDPRQANNVCIYGQMSLLMLVEMLENVSKIIQTNTDGVLVQMPEKSDPDEFYALIDDVAYEWEQMTGLTLEFDEYIEVFQKDVNNYIFVAPDGHIKSKGAYVKKLSRLDYDLPIVNKAIVEAMVHNVPVEKTIGECDMLKEFQMVAKASSKYTHIEHGGVKVNEKCIRIFASKDLNDGGVVKISASTGRPNKINNSPEHCFIFNDSVEGVKCPQKLDKQFYIDIAKGRLNDFGINDTNSSEYFR